MRAGLAALAVAAGTAVSWAALNASINYDVQWAIDWGQSLLRGDLPAYEATAAPTSHPMVTAIAAALLLVLPDDAVPGAVEALFHASHAGALVLAFLLAAELCGTGAGLAAGALLGCVATVNLAAAGAFPDVPAATLVLLAAYLHVRAPERPERALIALAAAGLLRPEVWGVAVAYGAWSAVRSPRRLRLAALGALGPALWMAGDFAVTGSPLVALTHTQEGAEAAHRVTGVLEGPRALYGHLRLALGEAVLIGAAIGALRLLQRRGPGREVVALAVLLACAFLLLGVAEVSLLERYLIMLMGISAVLFGIGVAGWRRGPGPAWARGSAAAVLLILGAAHAVSELDRTAALMDYARAESRGLAGLDALFDRTGLADRLRACGSVGTWSYRSRPYLAYELGMAPETVKPTFDRLGLLPARSAWVAPRGREATHAHGQLGRGRMLTVPRPSDFELVAENAQWRAYVRGC